MAFVSTKDQLKWNGETKGQIAQQGIYTFLMEYTDLVKSGTQVLVGEVLLVR